MSRAASETPSTRPAMIASSRRGVGSATAGVVTAGGDAGGAVMAGLLRCGGSGGGEPAVRGVEDHAGRLRGRVAAELHRLGQRLHADASLEPRAVAPAGRELDKLPVGLRLRL